ncbi:MYH7B protein, putative [Trypanosoma cruzi]|uniref:MYH7B protein, putative n=1 Tax=Trypanosoma cruzi (strain CL Brener) TaxID=353153 RepID=Q4CQI9_TRYCC|nr:MYH7B protein, putative [Trypanosoma cruzi]EAN82540.1 MYH7B protein, putative [Trypanosoma cruzi]|eukprot:XP_804391.1 MYH7B protein [Trypanosoma cruzi strain CL Brener]
MANFFRKTASTAPLPDTEEVEMLRQKVGTLEELVKRAEEELREEKEKLSTLQNKTAQWKEKVKELNAKDRACIKQLEEELKVIKAMHGDAPIPITAEIQSLVEKGLATLRYEHEGELGAKQRELEKALATASDRASELEKSQRKLEALQKQHMEMQQRFTRQMESLSKHHEMEITQLSERLSEADSIHELKNHISKQEDEIKAMESHSTQQAVLAGELQKEIAELTTKNNELQGKLNESLDKMSVMQEKQRNWKESVKNMKMQDMNTIQELREELERQKREASTESGLHPSHEEKLHQWKERVKHEKLKDMETIKDLTNKLSKSQQQIDEAQKLINNVAIFLEEIPPKVSHSIEFINKYRSLLSENFVATKKTASANSSTSTPLTARKDEKADQDTVRASQNLRAQLDEALQQREEVRRELKRTSEELAALREQSGADTVNLRAQLDEALQQREEVHRELKRTSEELAALREQSGADTVNLRAQLDEALQQREEVHRELKRTSEELAALREQSGADTVNLRAQLDEALQQREEVHRELKRTSEELAALREQSGADTVNLRAQLDEALQQREEARQSFRNIQIRLNEIERECEVAVKEKESGIRLVEEKLVLWKEKVVAAKARDDARIGSLEITVSSLRDNLSKLVNFLVNFLNVLGETVAFDVYEHGDDDLDLSLLFSCVDNFQRRLEQTMKALDVSEATMSLIELLVSLNGKVSEGQKAFVEISAELQRCQHELQEANSRLSEAETKADSLPSPELVAELEAKNSQLEEKCDLLRKEIKRQREAFQRDRALQGLSSTSATQEDGGINLRSAAGVVFERDMLSLANQQSQRDNEIRRLRVQLQSLEKENAEMKRECEHNNSVVAKYTKDIEVLKAKERVQQSIEYVRNVILRFLCCTNEELRLQMLPAISTVLEFSSKEKLDVQRANPSCPRFQ